MDGGATDMNAQVISPKLLIPAALTLAIAVCFGEAGVGTVRDREPLRAGTSSQASQTVFTGSGEPAELRVQSLTLRGG